MRFSCTVRSGRSGRSGDRAGGRGSGRWAYSISAIGRIGTADQRP